MIAALATVAALVAGGVASITGFGIGSLITPALAPELGIAVAVAMSSIPHLVAGVIRLAPLRRSIDRRVLLRFGLASAAGGLSGALLHRILGAPVLVLTFGLLLLATGLRTLLATENRWRFGTWTAVAAGLLSGLFGGLVGNQGGVRSAALLDFDLSRDSFVATATATGLVVDVVRLPVYLAFYGGEIGSHWRLLLLLVGAVAVGTLAGYRLLVRIEAGTFRRVVAAVVLLLGLYMTGRGVIDVAGSL